MGNADSTASPRIVIILVHGTFACDAPWTSSDSKLVRRLRAELPGEVLVLPFVWSGRNKLYARMHASRALAGLLNESLDDRPASHYVIAHSHGGNIALWAANSPLRAFIKGIVCLSTPFFHIGPRWQSGLVGVSSAWHLAVLAFVCWYDRQHNLSLLALLCWVGALALPGFLLISLIWFRLEKVVHMAQLNMIFPQEFQDRVLVLRAAGDEASQVLVAAQFGSWVVDRFSLMVRAMVRGIGRVIPDIDWEYDRSYKRIGKILCSIVLCGGEIAIFEALRRLLWAKRYIGSGTHQAIAVFIGIYVVLFVAVAIGEKGYTPFLESILDLFAWGMRSHREVRCFDLLTAVWE